MFQQLMKGVLTGGMLLGLPGLTLANSVSVALSSAKRVSAAIGFVITVSSAFVSSVFVSYVFISYSFVSYAYASAATDSETRSTILFTGSSQGMPYQVERIAQQQGTPWGIAFVDDQHLLVTFREGKAMLLNLDSGDWQQLSGMPHVAVYGQGGLLDVAKEPKPSGKPWYYFTYSQSVTGKSGQAATALARAKLEGNRLIQWQELLVTQSASDTSRHFGSRIAFDQSDHLFFSVGDRGHRPNGQDMTTHAGKILRLNLDGSVPEDNPFVRTPNALHEIWSLGHRNPQGMAYDSTTGRLWSIEHGPRGGDEINLIRKGVNYGWPVTSHGKEYWGPVDVGEATEKAGIESPKKVYIPSIAPGSLMLYTGSSFPAWRGNLFSGALKLRHLNRVEPQADGSIRHEERLLESLDERIRALAQSPEGWIYFSTDSGGIYRIRPSDQ